MHKTRYGIEIAGNIGRYLVSHPRHMFREYSRLAKQWFLARRENKRSGFVFEQHCHSNYSYDCDIEFEDIVRFCLKNKINVLSLTDHLPEPRCFDDLANGEKLLSKEYKVKIHDDGRSLEIRRRLKKMILLRSTEYQLSNPNAEIGIHGMAGRIHPELPLKLAISRAQDQGAFVVVNHPHYVEGIGYWGDKYVSDAIESGAIALERNSTEIMMYTHLLSEYNAKKNPIPIIPGGDAHYLDEYGRAGVSFSKKKYKRLLKRNKSHVETIQQLISQRRFKPYFNYISHHSVFRHIGDYFKNKLRIGTQKRSF